MALREEANPVYELIVLFSCELVDPVYKTSLNDSFTNRTDSGTDSQNILTQNFLLFLFSLLLLFSNLRMDLRIVLFPETFLRQPKNLNAWKKVVLKNHCTVNNLWKLG